MRDSKKISNKQVERVVCQTTLFVLYKIFNYFFIYLYMSLLDDESKIISDIKNNAQEELFCRYLGKVYMTKQGSLGYVLNINPDGTPKTLAYINSNKIDVHELYNLEYTLQSFYKEEGWYIPTREQFVDSIFISWYNTGLDNSKIISSLLSRSHEDFRRINFLYQRKYQPTPISPLRGVFWLKYGNKRYDMEREIFIENTGEAYFQIQYNNTTSSRELLFLKDLEESEIQSYEDSDKMIDDMINNLSLGRF